MSDLVPKKERYLGYWLQVITICISLLAVIASVFAGWMAYNASISSAEISGKMTKENEIESRLYQQRYDLYKKLLSELNQVITGKFEDKNAKNNHSKIDNITLSFRKILINYGPEIRTLASDDVVSTYSCVFKKVHDVIEDKISGLKCTNDMSAMECNNPKWWLYANNILGGMHHLENAIRVDLGGNPLPDLHIPDHGGWTTSITCSGSYNEEHYGIYGENNELYYEQYYPLELSK